MATTASTSIQGRSTYVQNAVFGGGGAHTALSPAASGTDALSAVVPADGAELVAATFTVTTAGVGGGSNQWSVSDGTNALFTQAATINTTAAGGVRTMTMGTATNGRNIATTAGSRLILTNTLVGTASTAIAGIFRLVWAL
jgi:hypothetical protein